MWSRCDPYPQCVVFRYDLATASATALPTLPAKVPYSPSVNQYGTVYYAQSSRGCGKSVAIMKQGLLGQPEVLASLPQGHDIDVSYAYAVPPAPPATAVTTHVFYDYVLCRKQTWDIYRVDDSASQLSAARLASDDHVLEELTGAAAGSPVDVPPVARLDLQARPLEDLRVEVAAVVDHDHDAARSAVARHARWRRRRRCPRRSRAIAWALTPRSAAPSSRSRWSSRPSSSYA